MLDGYGDIYVCVVLAVRLTVPSLVVKAARHDELRSRARPLTVIATEDGGTLFGRIGYQKHPRLAVAGRGCEAGYIKDGEDSVALDLSVRIRAARIALLGEAIELGICVGSHWAKIFNSYIHICVAIITGRMWLCFFYSLFFDTDLLPDFIMVAAGSVADNQFADEACEKQHRAEQHHGQREVEIG